MLINLYCKVKCMTLIEEIKKNAGLKDFKMPKYDRESFFKTLTNVFSSKIILNLSKERGEECLTLNTEDTFTIKKIRDFVQGQGFPASISYGKEISKIYFDPNKQSRELLESTVKKNLYGNFSRYM